MHILVTNDDGIRAPGIFTLAQELANNHQVTVVAPAEEQSGVSHAFTFLKPLMSDPTPMMDNVKAYAVRGTPADCVKLGCFHLHDFKPDVVIAGINRGANLGTDVLYSGTASAAMEGTLMGLPSIAVSLSGSDPVHYDSAACYACQMLDYIMQNPMPENVMLNLNVPDLPYDEVLGLKLTKLAIRKYSNHYIHRKDPRGRHYFWLSDDIVYSGDHESDEYWNLKQYATVTPVSVDVTNYEYMEFMKEHGRFCE